jgi:hypothetical protein
MILLFFLVNDNLGGGINLTIFSSNRGVLIWCANTTHKDDCWGDGGVVRLELLGGVTVVKDTGSGVGSHLASEETPHPDYWGERDRDKVLSLDIDIIFFFLDLIDILVITSPKFIRPITIWKFFLGSAFYFHKFWWSFHSMYIKVSL